MESMRDTPNYNYTKVNDTMGYPQCVKEITLHLNQLWILSTNWNTTWNIYIQWNEQLNDYTTISKRIKSTLTNYAVKHQYMKYPQQETTWKVKLLWKWTCTTWKGKCFQSRGHTTWKVKLLWKLKCLEIKTHGKKIALNVKLAQLK